MDLFDWDGERRAAGRTGSVIRGPAEMRAGRGGGGARVRRERGPWGWNHGPFDMTVWLNRQHDAPGPGESGTGALLCLPAGLVLLVGVVVGRADRGVLAALDRLVAVWPP